jgi:hypothetical protein
MMLSSSIYFTANDIISFFFMVEQYSIVHIYHNSFIYLSVDEYLGWFQNLLFVSIVTVNMGVRYLLYADFNSFEYMSSTTW